MDRVEDKAAHYIEYWNENYSTVNDATITAWLVSSTMRDIEYWIEGNDPNGARETAGMTDWTRPEHISLYQLLAPTAAFFNYTVCRDYMGVTDC
jgi:hypothetical protein